MLELLVVVDVALLEIPVACRFDGWGWPMGSFGWGWVLGGALRSSAGGRLWILQTQGNYDESGEDRRSLGLDVFSASLNGI